MSTHQLQRTRRRQREATTKTTSAADLQLPTRESGGRAPLPVVVGVEIGQASAQDQSPGTVASGALRAAEPARRAVRQAHTQVHAARKAAKRARQHAVALRTLKSSVREHEWRADQAAEQASDSATGARVAKREVLKALALRSSLNRAEEAMEKLLVAAQLTRKRAASALKRARRECHKLGVSFKPDAASFGVRHSGFHQVATGELR